MNTYRIYSIFHPGAVEIIEAETSFAARQRFAAFHRYDILDCVARRAFEFDRAATATTHAQSHHDVLRNR